MKTPQIEYYYVVDTRRLNVKGHYPMVYHNQDKKTAENRIDKPHLKLLTEAQYRSMLKGEALGSTLF